MNRGLVFFGGLSCKVSSETIIAKIQHVDLNPRLLTSPAFSVAGYQVDVEPRGLDRSLLRLQIGAHRSNTSRARCMPLACRSGKFQIEKLYDKRGSVKVLEKIWK